MKLTTSHVLSLSRAGFFILIALGIGVETSLATQAIPLKKAEALVNLESNKAGTKGQVVESGSYHIELVPEKSSNGIHLDIFVQRGDNHQTIPNAKVTAQVQLPNGSQKNLTFNYDAKEKHYTSLLAEKAVGQYQLKITADINGEKVNARFSFKQ